MWCRLQGVQESNRGKIEAPQQEPETVEKETERVMQEMTVNEEVKYYQEEYIEQGLAEETGLYFVLSAYYSPKPWQSFYTTGSYAWDLKLNWQGHTTASWKSVQYGMIAADSKYSFWTKIHLEWLWDFTVEDRWWAIKWNRIDIYMWEWEEALRKALQFGKKTVKWNIIK